MQAQAEMKGVELKRDYSPDVPRVVHSDPKRLK